PSRVVGAGRTRPVGGGVDHAGQHGIDADVVVAVFGGHRVDEREHGGLAGDVARGPGKGVSRGTAGDADDRPAARVDHVGQGGLADQVRRPQVQPQLVLEVADVGLVDPAARGATTDQVGN